MIQSGNMNETITVETHVDAPIETVWNAFNDVAAIPKWNAPSNDWHTPRAENNLEVGGTFLYRMEAKDGSTGFDFTGTYTDVTPHEHLAYVMSDGRKAKVTFAEEGEGTRVVTVFDPETENPHEVQRAGWQAILDNFKKYVETPLE